MKYHQGLPQDRVTSTPSVFILGSFDGLHLGHQYLLNEGRSLASALDLPLVVMALSKEPSLITPHHKRRLFESLDVDLLIDVPFSDTLKSLSAETFVTIVQQMASVHTWVGGTDLGFGRDREGSCATLAARTDMNTHFVERLCIGGEVVSSSRIRRLVAAGDLSLASALLGRPYSFVASATPLHPNAYALDLSGLCLPPAGEYAVTVKCPQPVPGVLRIEKTCVVTVEGPHLLTTLFEIVLSTTPP
jgi:cytidyltransferase-like protein